jgi:hypothetical protein
MADTCLRGGFSEKQIQQMNNSVRESEVQFACPYACAEVDCDVKGRNWPT